MKYRLVLVAAVAMTLTAAASVAATSPTAPTAHTLTPRQMTAAWERATAKYAPERRKLLARVAREMDDGPFHADWASLQQYRAPLWYANAKFGIFVHWGVYSVPAFGSEWYPRTMYQQGSKEYAHELATHGPQSTFGYKNFIPMFKAQHFDPDAWARLFRAAGARYVVQVAEHHDGFAMYDSKLSDWTAVKMGPKRDLVAALEKAVRAQGLHFGVSSHRAEHDWYFDTGREIDSDVNAPRYAGLYGPAVPRIYTGNDMKLDEDWTYVSQAFINDWMARTTELIDDYHPDLIYFDWWIGQPSFRLALPKILAYYYNQGRAWGGVVVDYKVKAFAPGAGTLDIERGQLHGIQPRPWQTDTSVSNDSWGYVKHDTYKTPGFIVRLLVDVVSKNGNLLLNIGPKADGTIPAVDRRILLAIGGGLKTNGAAIYGSRPWRVSGEGPTQVASGSFTDTSTSHYTPRDFRFTTHDGDLYAIEMAWPADGHAVIHSIKPADGVRAVHLLADGRAVAWKQEADGLHLTLPAKPVGEYAYVFRIALDHPVTSQEQL